MILPFILISFLLTSSPENIYWQQDVSYTIDVELDTVHHTLSGFEKIIYVNNSPDNLTELFIHLYPNAYKDRSSLFSKEMEQMGKYRFSFSKESARGWITIENLFIDGNDRIRSSSLLPKRITEMRIDLPEILHPGDTTILEFSFTVKIPSIFSRLGHRKTHYEITQWYPKMVVYDRKGWHPDGYHSLGEFYGEFGTFDVSLTVPGNMVVGATGELQESVTGDDGRATFRYRAENVHDFAIVCDPHYSSLKEYYGDVLITVLCFERDEKKWEDALQITRNTLQYYEEWYGPYPYKTVTVAEGYLSAGGGMEYPNLVIISIQPDPITNLFETVVMHEVGHQWFYGVLGSNEMDETWLDEGINSFSEIRYLEKKYGREENLISINLPFNPFSPITDSYYLSSQYSEKPVLTPAYEFVSDPAAYAGIPYSKSALVMDMLKNYIGEERFDAVMRTYYARYKFKHPTTEGFIEIVNEITGEDMNWFFDSWMKGTEKCDYEVKSVRRVKEHKNLQENHLSTAIRLIRKEKIAMDFELLLCFEDGSETVLEVDGNFIDTIITYQSDSPVKCVTIDPERKILESNRWNNYSPRKLKVQPLIDIPDFDSYQIFYYPYAWYQTIDGVQIGGGLQGREFIPMEKFHGKNSWDYHFVYGLKSHKFLHNATISFPFLRKYVSKFEFTHNPGEEREKISLRGSSYQGIFITPDHSFELSFERNWLKSNRYKTEKYWEVSKIYISSISYTHQKKKRLLNHTLTVNLQYSTGDYTFTRLTVRAKEFIKTSYRNGFSLRFFGGYVSGERLKQYRFYPSGSLYPTAESPYIFTYGGSFAPLEYWHVEGGADLKGYNGRTQNGDGVLSLNLFSPYILNSSLLPTSLFFDTGLLFQRNNDTEFLMDSGIRIKLGPVFFDFPFWINSPEQGENAIDFRWSFGMTTASVSLF
jgi:hypothetical protein